MTTAALSSAPPTEWRKFAQIFKVDEERREVWGRLVQEVDDKSDEIFDYESSKPYFEAWSREFQDATAHLGTEKSFGNVRAMHGNVAAGKFIAMNFNDAEKAIDVGAKIVDNNEWDKVLSGVYTGWSIGGSYVDGSRKAEKSDSGKTRVRYTAKPAEGSIVDSPCIPTAKFFDIKKADGSTLQKAFVEQPTPEDAVDELAKLLNAGSISPEALLKAARDSLEKSPLIMPNHVEPKAEESLEEVQPDATVVEVPAVDPVEDPDVEKREFSDKQRSKDADSGVAEDDGSYPIANRADLKNAIHAYGRSKDKAKTKAHIIARAKALGAEDELPKDWTKVEEPAMTKAVEITSVTGGGGGGGRVEAFTFTGAVTGVTDSSVLYDPRTQVTDGLGKTTVITHPVTGVVTIDSTADGSVRKYGLDSVSMLAQVLECITTIAMMSDWEEDIEGDNSPIPAALRVWVAEGARIFQDMSIEESNELVASLNTDKDEALVEMAARVSMAKRVQDPDIKAAELVAFAKRYLPAEEFVKTPADELADALKKYGARHSGADMDHLQKAHDHLVSMGAECTSDTTADASVIPPDTGNSGVEVLTAVKSDAGTLLKASLEAGELRAELSKRDDTISNLTKRLETLEAQPVPVKGKLRVVSKTHDMHEESKDDEPVVKSTPGKDNPEAALELMKRSLNNPGRQVFVRGMPIN